MESSVPSPPSNNNSMSPLMPETGKYVYAIKKMKDYSVCLSSLLSCNLLFTIYILEQILHTVLYSIEVSYNEVLDTTCSLWYNFHFLVLIDFILIKITNLPLLYHIK